MEIKRMPRSFEKLERWDHLKHENWSLKTLTRRSMPLPVTFQPFLETQLCDIKTKKSAKKCDTGFSWPKRSVTFSKSHGKIKRIPQYFFIISVTKGERRRSVHVDLSFFPPFFFLVWITLGSNWWGARLKVSVPYHIGNSYFCPVMPCMLTCDIPMTRNIMSGQKPFVGRYGFDKQKHRQKCLYCSLNAETPVRATSLKYDIFKYIHNNTTYSLSFTFNF